MKKTICILCTLVLAGSFAACSTGEAGTSLTLDTPQSSSASVASAVIESSTPQTSTPPAEVEQQPEEPTFLLDLEHMAVPVFTTPELDIVDLEIGYFGRVHFGYNNNKGLQGEASLNPGITRVIDTLPEIKALSLRFAREENQTKLRVEWEAGGQRGTDVFLLDEARNLWVHLRDGVLLYPVDLQKEDAARLFPEEELTEYSFVALLCYEPLYNLRVYWVWDFYVEGNGEYAQLLAEYDVYQPGSPYLWQSDSMYYKHLSIEYTDAAGRHYMQGFSIVDGKGIGSSHWILDQVDWLEPPAT